jgi:UDP-N-acetylglucosamine/UDP-N-acetylgalactosamine diphosphorylase
MLNQPPIFLGGQGGLVGPVRIEYGTVTAAGVVCRKDLSDCGKLVLRQDPSGELVESPHHVSNFYPGVYWYVKRRAINNINYIANLVALRHWYAHVRPLFSKGHGMEQTLYAGVLGKLDVIIAERIKRFKELAQKMPESIERYRRVMKEKKSEKLLRQKKELYERGDSIDALTAKGLEGHGNLSKLEPFLEQLNKHIKEKGPDYVAVIQGLDKTWSGVGTEWLQGIVDDINDEALERMPSFMD